MNNNKKTARFASWLRVRMAECNCSCRKLSEHCGVSLNSVANWRMGKHPPEIFRVNKIAECLAVKESTIRNKL